MAAARFFSSVYENLTIHHHFHSFFFSYFSLPKISLDFPFTNFSHLNLPYHFLNIIKPQSNHKFINPNHYHSQSIIIHHNFPKLHKTSFSPSSLTTNGLQSTKHPLKESHQPQAIHKQSQMPSYRIRTTQKRHSFYQ